MTVTRNYSKKKKSPLQKNMINYLKNLTQRLKAYNVRFYKNNTMVGRAGSTEDEWRPMTEEEIEDDIQWNRQKRNARRRTEKRMMQEILDKEKGKGKKKKEIKTLVKHKTVN